MKNTRRAFRALLCALALAAALAVPGGRASAAQNTNSPNTEDDILRQTRRCVRDAARRQQRCLRRAGSNRGRRARCRRTHREEASACSG